LNIQLKTILNNCFGGKPHKSFEIYIIARFCVMYFCAIWIFGKCLETWS